MSNMLLSVSVEDRTTVRARRENEAETTGAFGLSSLHRSIVQLFVDWLHGRKLTRRRELQVLGTVLYEALIAGDVARFFEQSVSESVTRGENLRIELTFRGDAGELASLPWEALYRPDSETSGGFFLATRQNLALSRYMPLEAGRPPLAPDQQTLRVLATASKPDDLGIVREAETLDAIRSTSDTLGFEMQVLERPSVARLLSAIEESRPHVVHLFAHGDYDELTRTARIALLDAEERNALWVPDREFVEYFEQAGEMPRLVLLHACEGATVEFHANFAGLAPQLIRAGAEAVVAMQYPVTNQEATAFSKAFYDAVAKGRPVDAAVQRGRWQMTVAIPNTYDTGAFANPVLYLHSRDAVVAPPPQTAPTEPVG